jgi:PKD repeat protein
VLSEQIFERSWESYISCGDYGCVGGGWRIKTDNLSNMEGMWRPIILNGSAYKGRTVFLRIDTILNSGQQWGNTCAGNGESFDVYFDEIHFSDEYGDYITYYTSVPPVPNYSYTVSDKTIAVNGTSSTDNGTITEYRWSWGDGTYSFGAIDTHLYSADGNYTVQLCVTDDEQMTVCIQKVINVNTTPTTNTIITGDTDDEEPTPPVVTPPATPPSNDNDGGSVTPPSNTFPLWGFIVTLGVVTLIIIGVIIITNPKKVQKIKKIGRGKKGGRRK